MINDAALYRSWHADRVDTLHEFCSAIGLLVLDGLPDEWRDASHDAHAQHDVVEVGQLDAVLRQRTADRTHAERNHVHYPTLSTYFIHHCTS